MSSPSKLHTLVCGDGKKAKMYWIKLQKWKKKKKYVKYVHTFDKYVL